MLSVYRLSTVGNPFSEPRVMALDGINPVWHTPPNIGLLGLLLTTTLVHHGHIRLPHRVCTHALSITM